MPGSGLRKIDSAALPTGADVKPEDRYELLEKIASGSFATVYRAHDAELKREVAVKQIHEHFLSDPQQLDRYWGEAQLLASLQHPNIVTIYDIVRDKGWLIMELMQGNLGDRMHGRPMDLVALRTVLAHSLRALKFLHEHGIVHGDIKPSNMLVDRRKRLKIGDFGLARRVSDEEGSLIKGTTKYMAPEVVSDEFGDVGPASDLYSLGFAAYDLMCGPNFETLFPGLNAHGRDKQLAWIMWHAAADRRLPPISRVLEGVPEDLAKVIQKLSTKNRAQRYKTADEALADLNVDLRVVKGEEQADQGGGGDPAAKRKRLMVIGAFAVSMLLSILMMLPGGASKEQPKAQSGLIREVRAATHEIVVVDEASGIPEVIKVGPKPSFLLKNEKNQRKILLEEVLPGDRVRIAATAPNLEFVLFRPINTQGIILRIDGVAKMIVVETNEEAKREDIPIEVGTGAEILINGDKAQFVDLREQDRIDAVHLPDSRNENKQVAVSLIIRRTVRATGFVRTLNWQGKKLTFDIRQGASTRMLELPFGKDCQVSLPTGSTVAAADLKADDLQTSDRVAVEYDTEITRVTATRNKTVTGTLKTINRGTRTISILTKDGQQHTLRTAAETEIDLGGETAQLEELREYDETRATYREHDDGSGLEAVTVDVTRPVKHDRIAIVIGMQNYQDKALPLTDYVLDDVQSLGNALRQRYCVAQERLLMFKDIDKGRFEEEIGRVLKDALAQTQILVYFEGQAYEGAAGKYYLAPRDFQLARPAETGVPLDWLVEALEKCASKDKLLILDTFQVGASAKYAPQPSPVKMLSAVAGNLKTTHAIAARSDKEVGQALPPDHKHGSFAAELTRAFKGAADVDFDLKLKPEELLNYLQQALNNPKVEKVQPQQPKLFGPRP